MPAIIVARQSLFVTSNQKVWIASTKLFGGYGSEYRKRRFHKYWSDDSAASPIARATTRGARRSLRPRGIDTARNSVAGTSSSTIIRWLPYPTAYTAKNRASRHRDDGRSLHQTSASSERVSMSTCSAYTSAMIACDQNVYDPANSRPVNAPLSVDCVMRAASH